METVNTFTLIKAMLDIAPKNDVRYYMNGVHITRGDGPEVTFEATDGHCLIRVVVHAPGEDVICVAKGTDVILCRTSLANLVKLFTYKNAPVLSASGRRAHLDFSDFSQQVEIATVDGRFPSIDRVLSLRSEKNKTGDTQGVNLALLARVARATGKLCEYAEFTAYDGAGFNFHRDAPAGTVTAVVVPTRM